MSSSIPFPSSVNLRRIRFQDNSELTSASQFSQDVRFKKRIRVEQESDFSDNVNIDGNLYLTGGLFSGNPPVDSKFYTDNQTGWGLSQWAISGAVYNPATDSLIVKIYGLEVNYASIAYVDSKIQNTSSKYLVAKDAGTVPSLVDPTSTYPYAATTLAANTIFYIRSASNAYNIFRFQDSPVIGHVLKCIDNEGTVGWAAEQSTAYSAQLISTSEGGTNLKFSLKVVDHASDRGFLFFPLVESNLYNKAITSHSTCLLLGTGDFPSSLYHSGIGCYSQGSEFIDFQGSTSTSEQNGKLRLTGGSSTDDQQISLQPDGIYIHPRNNQSIHLVMPHVTKNFPLNKWTKPVRIVGKNQPNDEFPTLKILKEDLNGLRTSFFFNPRSSAGAFVKLVEEKNPALIFGETTNYLGDASIFPTIPTTLTIGPWSNYGDGIQIRSSMLSEESSQLVSGFTRITGSSSVDQFGSVRVPLHYLEVNKQGVILKNSSSTKTVNFGAFEIKSKTGSILNNENTDLCTGSLTVGSISSPNHSYFYGDVNISSDLYLSHPSTVGINKVWTCTSLAGKGSWQTPQTSIPSNINVLTISTTTLDASSSIVTNRLTTSSLTQNFLIETLTQNNAFNILYNAESSTPLQMFYRANGVEFPTNNRVFIPRDEYFTLSPVNFIDVLTFQHNSYSSSLYNMYCPIWLYHEWNFYNNRQENDERENFWYELKEIQYKVTDINSNTVYEGTTGLTSEETVAVGFDRHLSGGPYANTNRCRNWQKVFIKSIQLYIPTTINATAHSFMVSIRPIFNFFYSGEYISNFSFYNGSNFSWNPFSVVINATHPPPTVENGSNQHIGMIVNFLEDGLNKTTEYNACWDQNKWNSLIDYKTGGPGEPGYWGDNHFFYQSRLLTRDISTLSPTVLSASPNNTSLNIRDLSVNKLLVSDDLQKWLDEKKLGISMTKLGIELNKYCKINKLENIYKKDKKISGKTKKVWCGIALIQEMETSME